MSKYINCRCSIPGHKVDSSLEDIRNFDELYNGLPKKEHSKLMLMTDREPLELWDWGLNEKTIIPTKDSDCSVIRNFIEFIETRKFK